MSGKRAKPRAKKTSRRTSASSRNSTATQSFKQTLQAAARALKGERWYLFGAQAVAIHGVPRVTADVDVTVEPSRAGLSPLMRRLERAGFVLKPVGDIDSFIAQTRVLPFTHEPTRTSLDVVLAGPGLEEGMLDRAVDRRLGGVRLRVIDINDLLVLKIIASRSKDLEDVAALLRAAPAGLDSDLVEQRLSEFERAIDASDLVARFREIRRRS